MYQLPIKFIEVSPDVAICATRIVAIMSTRAYQARETIKAERKAGTLINGCGNRTAETCIFLDNGSVISSPYKIPRLLKKIAKATEKDPKTRELKPSATYADVTGDIPASEDYEDDDGFLNDGDFEDEPLDEDYTEDIDTEE